MGGGDRAAERLGERVVDFAGEMIERALLVETAHLDRPFDGGPGAGDREPAVGFASDRLDAAVDFRRVRGVDGELGFARLLALVERRIIEEGKAHRALDFEGAIAGEKHRRRVRIDAVDLLVAVGRGIAQKGQHFLLALVVHVAETLTCAVLTLIRRGRQSETVSALRRCEFLASILKSRHAGGIDAR